MAQKRRYIPNKRQVARSPAPAQHGLRTPPAVTERAEPVVYGKPFILLEDAEKKTFIFAAGNWVEHSASIAECRQTCLVKELPQKLNHMTRYEIRSPQNAG